MARLFSLALACLAIAACGQPEDPAHTALRERLKQEAGLSDDELGRLRTEVGRSMEGRTFLIAAGGATRALSEEERTVVFGMLIEPLGMFDEGIRQEGGATVRVLNAPGRSTSAEIEASRRLSIDVDTFLPVHFQFAHAFPNPDDYSFDLIHDLR